MTDTPSLDDVRQTDVATRNDNGELTAQPKQITHPDHGEITVRVKPLTTGSLNELAGLDAEEIQSELDPKALKQVFSKVYVEPALGDLTESEISDMKTPALEAYLGPIEENLPDMEQGNQTRYETTRR